MHLGYLDDSDTKQKKTKLQVMSGVLVEDKQFKYIEIAMGLVRKGLIPEEKLDAFTEFHACELYGGYGVFEGIPQDKRFEAITKLLAMIGGTKLSVVYGAVDIAKARREIYGSADPLDISFRICIQEIHHWVSERFSKFDPVADEAQLLEAWLDSMVILIVDECNKEQRNMLQSSFRGLRHSAPSVIKDVPPVARLRHLHDDMFFGDSRYSVGIQLADLCSYFIARHLEGDEEIRKFYEMIEPHIVYGQLYPQESTFSTPQPLLTNLRTLLELKGHAESEPGIREVRSDDAEVDTGSARENQGQAGSGESSKKAEA